MRFIAASRGFSTRGPCKNHRPTPGPALAAAPHHIHEPVEHALGIGPTVAEEAAAGQQSGGSQRDEGEEALHVAIRLGAAAARGNFLTAGRSVVE